MNAVPKRVVVVLNPDGYVEVFSTANVNAVIINRPNTLGDIATAKTTELIEQVLPGPYRDLLWPGNKIATGQLTPMTVDDIEVQLFRMGVFDLDASNRQKIFKILGGDHSGRVNRCPYQDRLDRLEATMSAETAQRSDVVSRPRRKRNWSNLIEQLEGTNG